jgi:putative heme iron utilization protein
MKKQRSINYARNLLRSQELAVLSTHSKSVKDYPFGSVTTYISTVNGEPIFYISNLAQHTHNILNNPKMCLTVFEGNQNDPNAGARLSIMGEAILIDGEQVESIKKRFFTLFPDSTKYEKMHDFNFYILKTTKVRYIGGFGDINWISKEDWLLETPTWLESESDMIKHMNEDHAEAMDLICFHKLGYYPKNVEMLAINPEGYFFKSDGKKPAHINFEEKAVDDGSVRKQLVKLTHAARDHLEVVSQQEKAS